MVVYQLFLPTLSVILAEGSAVPIVSPTASTLEAAKLMLEKRISAGMVMRLLSLVLQQLIDSTDCLGCSNGL